MTHLSFPAKLLLFGEYTIINGGTALAIPFDRVSGQWDKGSTTDLMPFFEHIKNLPDVDELIINQAKQENWVFNSTIPIGYGLGSSGAISAAAYESFFPMKESDLSALQKKLSEIESHFHGKSSGLDPLTCYLNKPILVQNGEIKILEELKLPDELRLYDSGQKRNGKPLIKYYLDRLEVDETFDEVVLALSRFNERIVNELIEGRSIEKSFKEISHIQFNHFKHMIPQATSELWQKGLESDEYYFKLSGAGGGGYFLVYAKASSNKKFSAII